MADAVSERSMLDALHRRYDFVRPGTTSRRWAVAEHAPDRAGYVNGGRIADFVAVDCYGATFGEPSVHWHEVKVARSDWLRELAQPHKSEMWRAASHYWWLVVPDVCIVRDDLPDGWGLIATDRTGALRVRVAAPRHAPAPMPLTMTAALLRSTQTTQRRRSHESRLTDLEAAVLRQAADGRLVPAAPSPEE